MPNPRKPRGLKVLEGTLRKDRDYPEPDLPLADDPEPPDWLLNAEAVKEWRRLVGLLTAARVLTDLELSQLAQYCNIHADCIRLWRAGMSPTAAQLSQLRLYASDFGMTPASRSKAGAVKDGGKKNAFSAVVAS